MSLHHGGFQPAWELGAFLNQEQPLLAIQQLLLKGLFKPETEAATIQVNLRHIISRSLWVFCHHSRSPLSECSKMIAECVMSRR